MIRICKNFTPTVNAKRSSINIKDNDTSKRIFDILHILEPLQGESINKTFDPESYNLCEELYEIVRETGLIVKPTDHLYFTELIKNVKYWHIYREIETVRNSELLEEIDDETYFDYTEYCDNYYIEAVGFE